MTPPPPSMEEFSATLNQLLQSQQSFQLNFSASINNLRTEFHHLQSLIHPPNFSSPITRHGPYNHHQHPTPNSCWYSPTPFPEHQQTNSPSITTHSHHTHSLLFLEPITYDNNKIAKSQPKIEEQLQQPNLVTKQEEETKSLGENSPSEPTLIFGQTQIPPSPLQPTNTGSSFSIPFSTPPKTPLKLPDLISYLSPSSEPEPEPPDTGLPTSSIPRRVPTQLKGNTMNFTRNSKLILARKYNEIEFSHAAHNVFDKIPLQATNLSRVNALRDVQHVFEALTQFFGTYRHNLFDSCVGKITWPYSSVIGSKIDWVLPEIDGDNIASAFKANRISIAQLDQLIANGALVLSIDIDFGTVMDVLPKYLQYPLKIPWDRGKESRSQLVGRYQLQRVTISILGIYLEDKVFLQEWRDVMGQI